MEYQNKKIPQKKSVFLLVFLSIITIGIYPAVWYIKRVSELNNLNTTKKLGKGIPITILILSIISILALICFLVLIPLSFFISFAASLIVIVSYISYGIYILTAILFLIISFNFRSVINEVLIKKGTNQEISILFTIFFNFLYLQYEINRTIEDKEYKPRTGPWIWFVIYAIILLYELYLLIIPYF